MGARRLCLWVCNSLMIGVSKGVGAAAQLLCQRENADLPEQEACQQLLASCFLESTCTIRGLGGQMT